MKKGSILVLALLLLVTCFFGCSEGNEPIADGKNVIDVFAGVDISDGYYTGDIYNARDGSGHYWIQKMDIDLNKVNYDKSNADIKDFLKDIDVYLVEDVDENLRNGDVITLGLEYSKSQAEELGISLLSETKQVTVDWLKPVYREASQVDAEKVRAIYEQADPVQRALNCFNWYTWYGEQPDYSHTTSEKTYLEYAADGNGDPYVAWLLALVRVDFEYEDGGEYVQGFDWALVKLELDGSDANFDYLQSEKGYQKNEMFQNRHMSVLTFQSDYMDGEDVLVAENRYQLTPSGELVYLNEGDEAFELEPFDIG